MTPTPPSKREVAQNQYNTARFHLLLMLLLTVANAVLLLGGSDRMMLFSASIPYFALGFGRESGSPLWFGLGIAAAVLLIVAYVLCWRFSKKTSGWMVAALVLFVIDTLCMLTLYVMFRQLLSIWDILFHAWVIYDLVKGVINAHKLKTLPEETIDWMQDM